VLSPDGTRYVYADDSQMGALYASNLDGTSTVKLTSEAGTNAAWSPDGTKVAYLVFDNTADCSQLDVVASDGSTAASPTRLRDCTKTGEFITELAWFVEP
jgi:Tol biopolymer transport system component